MKKNNKGFTLIELLAIIVILAIIAVITMPVILNVIENSRKGASVDSAYGYKESVQQFYILKAVADYNDQAPSGYKKVSSLSSEGFSVSGDTPTDGWVKLDKGQVIDYSLKFGYYVVSYDKTTNSAVSVKNGEIGPMPAAKLYSESNNVLTKKDKSQMQAGDIVVLETETLQEKFIVLNDATHIDPKAPTGTTALLAVNLINISTGYQSSYGSANGGSYVKFSQTDYWSDYSDKSNIYDSSKDKAPGNADYSVAYYVNDYIKNLKNNGFDGINSGRILTYEEVYYNGIAASFKEIIGGTSNNYWLSSAVGAYSGVNAVYYNNQIAQFDYSGTQGVRPLIYINTDDIE